MWGFISLRKHGNGPIDATVMACILTDNTYGGMDWDAADYEYCEAMANQGVYERRGYTVVNDIVTWLYYLPPPQHTYTTGP